jgi:hypothetical protein
MRGRKAHSTKGRAKNQGWVDGFAGWMDEKRREQRDGGRSADDGSWLMAHGKEDKMADGQETRATSQQLSANSYQPRTNSQEPTATNHEL